MADGRRSLRELSKRRHAVLALPRSTTIERKRRKVNPEEVVGWLTRTDGTHEIMVTLGAHIWIGRAKDCDVRLRSPEISAYHLRLYAIRTSTSQSLVCVQDASINGYTLNDTSHQPEQVISIGGVQFSNRQAILREGDTLVLPGCEEGYIYHHAKRHALSSQSPQSQGVIECRSKPLFPSVDPSLTHSLPPWTVHNFSLGHGTFGVVHLATSTDNPSIQVACKTLDVRYLDKNRFILQNEVEILKKATHPNLCGILDVIKGPEGRHSHLILPLVVGGDLFTYFEKHGALSEPEVQFMAIQMLEAVEFLHVRQIAHRDIKPENILLRTSSAYPHILLGDFGLATTFKQVLATVPDSRVQNTVREYTLNGTASYMPPEHLRSILGRARGTGGLGESIHGGVKRWREEVGKQWFEQELAWDKWALGVVLYTIMAGMHPYDHGDDPDAEGEAEEVAPKTPYRRLTSTKSWEAFRKEKGEGTLGQSDAKKDPRSKEWEQMLRAAETFSSRDTAAWQPVTEWDKTCPEARHFISLFLARSPVQRPDLTDAKSHEWLKSNKAELKALYRAVVQEGQLACGRGAKRLVARTPSPEPELPGSPRMDDGVGFDLGFELPTPTLAPRKGKGKSRGMGEDTSAEKGSKTKVRSKAGVVDEGDDGIDMDAEHGWQSRPAQMMDPLDETDPPRRSNKKTSRRKVVEEESSAPPPPRPAHRQTSIFLPDSGIFSQPLVAIAEAEEVEEEEEEEEEEEHREQDNQGPVTLAAAFEDMEVDGVEEMDTMDVELGETGSGMEIDGDSRGKQDPIIPKHARTPGRSAGQAASASSSKNPSSKSKGKQSKSKSMIGNALTSTSSASRRVALAPSQTAASPLKKTHQAPPPAQVGSSSKSPVKNALVPAPIAIKSRGMAKVTVTATGPGGAGGGGGLFASAGGSRQ